MGVKVTRPTQAFPSKCWDVQAMTQLAKAAQAAIVERTFHRGVGQDDQPLAAYSTTPITIAFDSDTGRRLRPRGGTPVYGFGSGAKGVTFEPGQTVATDSEGRKRYKFGRSFLFRDTSDDGDTGSTRGPMTGRHYEGGYRDYKLLSRRGMTNKSGATGAEVNLTLSGQLSRSLEIVAVSQTRATIVIKGAALEYGPATDARRPWLAHSPRDVRDLEDIALPPIINAALRRGSRR